MSSDTDHMRTLWDTKSATYDNSTGHHPRSTIELAAWGAAMRRLLPPPPARVLDVGAGTGFLSILLARQGYDVTGLDLSEQMLERLRQKAQGAGLTVRAVVGDAQSPPEDGFDAVVSRHLLWTLPQPEKALDAWRRAAPGGRLVLFECEWGRANGTVARARSKARALLRRVRQECPADHTSYGEDLRAQLPLVHGTPPEQLLELVEASSWGAARVERLRDVDWASYRSLPSGLDRLIGVPPAFAVIAG